MYLLLLTLTCTMFTSGCIIAFGGLYAKIFNSVAICAYGYAVYMLLNTRVRVKMFKIMGRVFHNTKRRYDVYKRNYLLMPKMSIYSSIRKHLLGKHDEIKE